MEFVLAWLVLGGGLFALTKRGERFYARLAGATATAAGYTWGASHRKLEPKPAPATKNAPGKRAAAAKRTGSTTRKAAAQPTSIREAARTGWAAGVESAVAKRAEGRDLIGRTRRVVHWTSGRAGRAYTAGSGLVALIPGARKRRERKAAERAEKAAALDAAKATHATEDPPTADELGLEDWLPNRDGPATRRFFVLRNSGYSGPIDRDGRAVTDDRLPFHKDPPAPDGQPAKPPAGAGTDKENTMAGITDLINVDAAIQEGRSGQQVADNIRELWAELLQRTGSMSERYGAVQWGTPRIDQAATALADAREPEAIAACYAEWITACEEAKAAAEPLAAVNGRGDVRDFQDA